MSGTVNNNVYGATSVQSQQQEACVLAFTVPPATSGSSFSFSISAVGGPTLGTITTPDPNLQVSGSTVTVLSGFTGPSTVTISLTGANVPSASFTITQSSATSQSGTQTSLTVDTFGWFMVTALGTGASFNALAYLVTGLPSGQNTRLSLPCPLFLIPSVSGTTDFSFRVDGTSKVKDVSIAAVGSGLTSSNNTVTATSGLTAGMRSSVTVNYTQDGIQQTAQFYIQRLSSAGTGADSKIEVGQHGHIRVKSLPAGVYLRGNNIKYEMTAKGNYSVAFAGVGGVAFNTNAVTFSPSSSALKFTLAPSGTSVTINDVSSGMTPPVDFTLHTNLGSIDPQIVNNPDDDQGLQGAGRWSRFRKAGWRLKPLNQEKSNQRTS
jgi:hypothetical protein